MSGHAHCRRLQQGVREQDQWRPSKHACVLTALKDGVHAQVQSAGLPEAQCSQAHAMGEMGS